MPEAFVTVPGDRHSEVARTLAEPVPQALSALDQLGLWGNLGVSLLGFTGAIFVLQPGGTGTPELSLAAALTAIVLGTVLGTLPVALAGLPGTRTGAPAMVLLRGLFGARLSYLPTALNILQCLGWGIFELVTIATAAHTVAPSLPRWAYILFAGVATALLTIRPLGAIRILRRYVTAAVVIVLAYLFIQLLRHPLPPFTHGTWGAGFWVATDTVVAAAISFAPLAADYTRHSRSQAAAFNGAFFGYGATQVLCYVIGLLALVTVAHGNSNDIYGAFIALPARRDRVRHPRPARTGPVLCQRVLDRRVDPEPAPALGPPGAGHRHLRGDHGRGAVPQHQRLRELPDPARLGVRADVRRAHRGLLRPRQGPLGPVAAGPHPLADAAAMGRRVRHLPAHQPRLHLLVGVGVDATSPRRSGSRPRCGCPRRSARSRSPRWRPW